MHAQHQRLIAATCETSFAFPKSLASMMYPSAAAMLRRPEMANSRAMTTIVIHAGTTRTCTSAIRAEDTSSLSAIGSSNVPTVVICAHRGEIAVKQIGESSQQKQAQRQHLVCYFHEPEIDGYVTLDQRGHE